MSSIYLLFGSNKEPKWNKEISERDVRKRASESGESLVEIFDLSTADVEQLKQFSYLVHPQDGASFLNDDKTIEQYLDILEESVDPEKILSVLSLSGQSEVPLQFLQAIHHLYEKQALEENSAEVGPVHYRPNIDAHSLFGYGFIEQEEIEKDFDIPLAFEEAEDIEDTPKKQNDEENFSAELLGDSLD